MPEAERTRVSASERCNEQIRYFLQRTKKQEGKKEYVETRESSDKYWEGVWEAEEKQESIVYIPKDHFLSAQS